jgi:hypothetical protein
LAPKQTLYCIADSRVNATLQQQQAGRGTTTIYRTKYVRVKGRGTVSNAVGLRRSGGRLVPLSKVTSIERDYSEQNDSSEHTRLY